MFDDFGDEDRSLELGEPTSDAHPGTVTKGQEDKGMDLLEVRVALQPTFRPNSKILKNIKTKKTRVETFKAKQSKVKDGFLIYFIIITLDRKLLFSTLLKSHLNSIGSRTYFSEVDMWKWAMAHTTSEIKKNKNNFGNETLNR